MPSLRAPSAAPPPQPIGAPAGRIVCTPPAAQSRRQSGWRSLRVAGGGQKKEVGGPYRRQQPVALCSTSTSPLQHQHQSSTPHPTAGSRPQGSAGGPGRGAAPPWQPSCTAAAWPAKSGGAPAPAGEQRQRWAGQVWVDGQQPADGCCRCSGTGAQPARRPHGTQRTARSLHSACPCLHAPRALHQPAAHPYAPALLQALCMLTGSTRSTSQTSCSVPDRRITSRSTL